MLFKTTSVYYSGGAAPPPPAFNPDQEVPPPGPLLILEHVRLGIVHKKIVRDKGKKQFYSSTIFS